MIMSVPAGPEVPSRPQYYLPPCVALSHMRSAFHMTRQYMANASMLTHCRIEGLIAARERRMLW